MPDSVTIRPERAEDVTAIRAVNIAAFGRPGAETLEADIVDALRDHGKAILSLVAVLEDAIVGHVLFSPLTFEPPQPLLTGIALGPLAVVPAFQRQGIGSALVKAGLEECRLLGYGSVFLLGYPAYYSRFGFRPASAFDFRPPMLPRDPDAFQAIELRPGALDGVSGVAFERRSSVRPASSPAIPSRRR
jgi:putative acetyltransferase